MPDEDLNLDTGANDGTPAAEGQNQDGEKMVPLSALQAIREELQTVKGQLSVYQTQLRMGQAMPQGQQSQHQQEEEDFLPGVDDDEPLTKKEIASAFRGAFAKMQATTTAMTDEAAFLAKHPDYEEVVTKHLPTLFEAEPELLRRLQRNPDPYLAYKIGITAPSYRAKQAKEKIAKNDHGRTAEQNARKPGSPSQVSGQTGQDARDKIARMSRDEFRAHMERVKRGGR